MKTEDASGLPVQLCFLLGVDRLNVIGWEYSGPLERRLREEEGQKLSVVFPMSSLPSYDEWCNFFPSQHSSSPKPTILAMCVLIVSSLTLF